MAAQSKSGRVTGRGGHGPLGPWMRFSVMFVKPVTRLMFKHRWVGTENVPATGGVILVANHISLLDPFTIAAFTYDAGRLPRFMIKSTVFDVRVVGRLLRAVRQIPVHRGTDEATSALAVAEQALLAGELVVVYPEGTVTRDPDWWPMQPKTGLARLWLATGAAVVPVAQWGQHRALDYHSKRVRLVPRKRAVVRAGAPVDLSAFRGRAVTPELLHEITETAFGAVRDLVALERGEPAPPRFWIRHDGAAA